MGMTAIYNLLLTHPYFLYVTQHIFTGYTVHVRKFKVTWQCNCVRSNVAGINGAESI